MKNLAFLLAWIQNMGRKGATIGGFNLYTILSIVFFVVAFGTIVLDPSITSSGTGFARLGYQLNATTGALLGGTSGFGNAMNIILVLAIVFGVVFAILGYFKIRHQF